MSTILLDPNETWQQSVLMANAWEEDTDMLKVLTGGQWSHKNLTNCLKNHSKDQEKIDGALLFSGVANAGLLLMGLFCTRDICRCHSLCEKFQFIDAWEPGGPYFWEIVRKFLRNC